MSNGTGHIHVHQMTINDEIQTIGGDIEISDDHLVRTMETEHQL
jgi:hypothetical protein